MVSISRKASSLLGRRSIIAGVFQRRPVTVVFILLTMALFIMIFNFHHYYSYYFENLSEPISRHGYKMLINGPIKQKCMALPECQIIQDWRWTNPCTFYESGIGPIPVILIALGRTGSSITWSTMSKLTGGQSMAYEKTGRTDQQTQQFFKCLEKCPICFHNWTMQSLCHIQQRRPDVTINSGIAGFQWKPHETMFSNEYAVEGLKEVGKSLDPKVKVVFLTRNPLDRKISNLRHDQGRKTNNELPAHCKAKDTECKRAHSDVAENGVTLPEGDHLIQWLKSNDAQNEKVIAALKAAHIDYLHVSYEKVYNSRNASEWMNIFRYLGVGPSIDLTMDQVRDTFDLSRTHSKGRNATISNFIEVERTLKGTKFEHLLNE